MLCSVSGGQLLCNSPGGYNTFVCCTVEGETGLIYITSEHGSFGLRRGAVTLGVDIISG